MELDPDFHRGFRRENTIHKISLNGDVTTDEAGDFGHRRLEITRLNLRESSEDMRLTQLNSAT